MTLHEVTALVAARRGIGEETLESTHSREHILLKRHFDVREDRRLIDYEASLMAYKTAEILAKAFGG